MGNNESVQVSRFNDRKSMPIISPCPLAPVVRLAPRTQSQPTVYLRGPCCSNEDWTDLGDALVQAADLPMSSQPALPGTLAAIRRCSLPCAAHLELPPNSNNEFVICAGGCHLLSIQPAVRSVPCQAFVHQAIYPHDFNSTTIDTQAINSQAVHHKAIYPQDFNPKMTDTQTIDPQTVPRQAINHQDFNPETIDPQTTNPQVVNLQDVLYQAINTQAVSTEAVTTHVVHHQLSHLQTLPCTDHPPESSATLSSLTSCNPPSQSLSGCAENISCGKVMLEDEGCLIPTEFASQLSTEEVLEEMTEADQAARLQLNEDIVLRERGSSGPLKLESVLSARLQSSAQVCIESDDTVLEMDHIDVESILSNKMRALSLKLEIKAIPNKDTENSRRDALEESASLQGVLTLDTDVTRQNSSSSLTSSSELSPNDVEVGRCSLFKNQITGEYYTVSIGSLDSNSVGSSPTLDGPRIVYRMMSTLGDHSDDHVDSLPVHFSMGSQTGGQDARFTVGYDSGSWVSSRGESVIGPVRIAQNNMSVTTCGGVMACGLPRENSCTSERKGAQYDTSSDDSSSTLVPVPSNSSSPWGDPTNENFSRNLKQFLTAGTADVENSNSSHHGNNSNNNDNDNDYVDEREAYQRLQVALYRSVRFYVAFLCCAPDNLMDFGLPFHRMLENWGLPICREMDLDAGIAKYEGMARCVEERCNGKIIVILSKTYVDSEECLFLTYFAKTLDPDSKNRNIIPVMIDKDVRIPNVIRGLSIIKYNYAFRCGWLKKKLVSALAA